MNAIRLERYVESIEKLSESFHLNHEFYDSLISRANVYVDFGKEEAFVLAQKDYEHVIVMDSRNIDAHINLAYLYQITGRFMKAWQQFTTAMQIKPGKLFILMEFKFFFSKIFCKYENENIL